MLKSPFLGVVSYQFSVIRGMAFSHQSSAIRTFASGFGDPSYRKTKSCAPILPDMDLFVICFNSIGIGRMDGRGSRCLLSELGLMGFKGLVGLLALSGLITPLLNRESL